MSTTITNFSSLKTAITFWVGDQLNVNVYPDFIALFEMWFNRRAIQLGGIRQMETAYTFTPALGTITLPTDFLAARAVYWTGESPAKKLSQTFLQDADIPGTFGIPESYLILGSGLSIRPVDSSADDVVLYYWQKLPALSDSQITNWLLNEYPDLYLFGSLVESCAFGEHDDYLQVWRDRRDAIMQDLVSMNHQTQGEPAKRSDTYY